MGVLTDKRVYLSAPIENESGSPHWRKDVAKVLTEEFGLTVFDPHADPKQQWAPVLYEARKNKDFDTITKHASDFVSKDLSLVDRSDFLITYLPYKVSTVGTHHETIYADERKKVTIIMCPEGLEFIPFWYFGIVNKKYMFDKWNDVYNYLREVNAGIHKNDKRWSFVYGLI